ncbi:MAG: lipopolysaccharide biosynthesis protein [Eubacteriales bacterium]|nr:lipopolysaccharide biosynthesis protein [Eubacteriales bacterium]
MQKKSTVAANMLWRFAERSGAQGVSFVVSIILARLLEPEVYGVVSLITVITTILNLFVDSGFKNALIQKQDADQLDFSTVFYFNVGLGVVLYLGMAAAAPAIAYFYHQEYMTPYIRVLSLTLVLGGINGVQTAIVSKRMEFKRFFYATLGGTLVSAVVGIAMAYCGMGVWALIAQRLVNQTIDTLVLWRTVRWRPSLVFSYRRLKPMFAYGSKLLGSSLLDSFTTNLTSLIVGKLYSVEALAYYEKGRNVPFLVVQNLQTAVQSVLFPVIAECQDEEQRVRMILHRSLQTSAYCIFPCMIWLGVCAEPLIRLLFTEKWIAMVPYMQLWCLICAFYLLHTANLQVIQALGRSDIYLKIECIKQGLTLAGIVAAAPFGTLAMLKMMAAVTVVSFGINAKPNEALVSYGLVKQVKALSRILLLNVVMGCAVYLTGFLPVADIGRLMLQAVTGITVYLAGSSLLKLDVFVWLLETVRDMLKRHNQ